MRPQQAQQQWVMGQQPPPIDFLTGGAKISPVDGSSLPSQMSIFEPTLMDTLPQQPQHQQQQQQQVSNSADETSGFFDQSDVLGGVVGEEVCTEPVTQSQISQLLSPSPVNSSNNTVGTWYDSFPPFGQVHNSLSEN